MSVGFLAWRICITSRNWTYCIILLALFEWFWWNTLTIGERYDILNIYIIGGNTMEFSFDSYSIASLLSIDPELYYRYSVPLYQREYAWTKDNVRDQHFDTLGHWSYLWPVSLYLFACQRGLLPACDTEHTSELLRYHLIQHQDDQHSDRFVCQVYKYVGSEVRKELIEISCFVYSTAQGFAVECQRGCLRGFDTGGSKCRKSRKKSVRGWKVTNYVI